MIFPVSCFLCSYLLSLLCSSLWAHHASSESTVAEDTHVAGDLLAIRNFQTIDYHLLMASIDPGQTVTKFVTFCIFYDFNVTLVFYHLL